MAENTAVESAPVEKIQNNVSQGMGLIYGLGMMTFSGFNQMLTQYWNYFLTNAVGMDPAAMGTLTSTASLVAWFFVIIAAFIVEKIWFRWGQYRSYILLAPPLTLLFILGAWTDWTWLGVAPGSSAQVFLIGGCYLAGQFFINLFMISGTSMITVASKTEADRALLSSRKGQGNMAIKVLFAFISLPMILFFAGEDPMGNAKPDTVIGYTMTALVWGLVFVAAFVFLFIKFKGMDPTEEFCAARAEAKKRGEKLSMEASDTQKVTFVNGIKYFFTNLPALGLFLGEVGRAVVTMTLSGMAIYYCSAVYNDNMLYKGMMTIANICGLVGTFAGEQIGKFLGNRMCYFLATCGTGLSMLAGYLVGDAGAMIFSVIVCCVFFFYNIMMSVEYSCMANAITYQEYKNGETAKAFIMGTIQWCPNIGKMIQGALVGYGLSAIGYSKYAVMTPEMVSGINMLTFLVPAIVCLACAALFFFMHRLTAEDMKEAQEALAAREAAKKAAKNA